MLTHLSLSSFRRVESLSLDLREPLVFVLGPNEAGKSSLRDAIAFALTGLCCGVKAKNRLGEVVCHGDRRSAEVTLHFDGLQVTRSVQRSGTQALRMLVEETGEVLSGPIRQQQARLYDWLQTDELRAHAALDGRRFLDLDPDARRERVIATLGAQASAERVHAKLVEQIGRDGEDVSDAARDAAQRSFRDASEALVERRREVKRDLKALDPPEAPGEHGGVALGSVEESKIIDQIAALEKEQREAAATGGAERGRVQARIEEREREERELDTKARAGLPERLQKIPDPEQIRAETADLRAKIVAVEAEMTQAPPPPDPGQVAHPGTCPVLPGDFRCPATEAKLAKLRESLEARRDELVALHEKAEAQRAALHDLRIRLQTRQRDLNDAESRLQERERVEQARKEAAERLAQVRIDLKTLRERLAGMPEAVEDDGELAGRLAAGRRLLDAKRSYDAARKAQAESEEKRAWLEAELGHVDTLARALEPGGPVETAVLREALDPLNERLGVTGGLLGAVGLDGLLDLQVLPRSRAGWSRALPDEALSGSQRLRLGTIAQDLLAFRSQVPVLVLDEVDTYDAERQAALVELLPKLVGNPYGSVLVLATLQREPRKLPVPGSQTFVLADGVATELGGEGFVRPMGVPQEDPKR